MDRWFDGMSGVRRTVVVAVAALTMCLLSPGLARTAAAAEDGADTFDESSQDVPFGNRTIEATYSKPLPLRRPGELIVFFTGDAGWLGTSGDVFTRLEEHGAYVAGFSSRQLLKPIKDSGERLSAAVTAEAIVALFTQAKTDLGLPATTPVIVVGFSRGASAVAIAAIHPRARKMLGGAIAIALTRESDYLRAPDPARRPPEIQVDEENRIQLYPALKLCGPSPLAVIQSTGDKYVPAAESRQLLGPDTPTVRLYTVEAKNHGFSGGRDALLRDLDDALSWIETKMDVTGGSVKARG